MAELHDPSVTEAVNSGIDQILKAAATVEDDFGRLKVLTGAAALILELAKRSFHSIAVRAAFHNSKIEMRKAARIHNGTIQ